MKREVRLRVCLDKFEASVALSLQNKTTVEVEVSVDLEGSTRTPRDEKVSQLYRERLRLNFPVGGESENGDGSLMV